MFTVENLEKGEKHKQENGGRGRFIAVLFSLPWALDLIWFAKHTLCSPVCTLFST